MNGYLTMLARSWLSLFLALFWNTVSAETTARFELLPIKVAPNTYYVQGQTEMGSARNRNFISNSGFVITPQGVVVVDALGSPVLARALIAAIGKLTPQLIHTVIVTHYHADHIYGLQEFKALGARIIAHRAGRDYLTSETAAMRLASSRVELAPWIDAQTRLVAADDWLSGAHEFTLGGVRFALKPVGPAHTTEDLALFMPDTGVLFAGDLVFQKRIPYVGNADSQGWIAALNAMETLAPKIVVPGHGPYSTDATREIRFTRDYLIHLRHSMSRAAINLDSFDDAYAAADWAAYENVPLFRAVNRMNAYNVYLSIQSSAP